MYETDQTLDDTANDSSVDETGSDGFSDDESYDSLVGDEGDGTGDTPGASDDDTLELDADFYDWLKEKDPNAIRKTVDKFTQEWDGVLKEKEQLAPAMRLYEALQQDPGLLTAVEDYYNRPDSERDPMEEVKAVRAEVGALQNRLSVERELIGVAKYATESGFPEPDSEALLAHARDNNIGNLKSAYHDLYFEQISEAKKEAALSAIKKSKGAASVRPQGGDARNITFSPKDIQNMSSEEFLKNFDQITAQYKRR